MKVLITGGTGFVGKVIVRQLLESGDEVVVLTRNVAKAALALGSKCKYYQWSDTQTEPPLEAFQGVDGIINLMGESIASKKWDEPQKEAIRSSRIVGTAKLLEGVKKSGQKPRVLVSTSAVGIYGSRGAEEINEESPLGNDFLASVCKDWEAEALKAKSLNMRVAIVRVGVVLGRGGGALSKMLPIFKLGLGGPAGDGKQFMSWIHVEDLATMYIECLKKDVYQGVYNATAPYPATNADFTKALSRVLHRPAFFKAPAFAMKALMGDMSSIILEGQKVLPVKMKEKNFRFRYPTLEMALKETAY